MLAATEAPLGSRKQDGVMLAAHCSVHRGASVPGGQQLLAVRLGGPLGRWRP